MDFSVTVALLGCCFFFSLHYFFRFLVQSVFKRNKPDAYVISCRCVSASQAIIASVVGAIITSSCQDIMKDVHWLTNSYLSFGFPYFMYDSWAMYAYNVRIYSNSYSHLSIAGKLRRFVLTNKVMMIHHIFLPFVLFPLIVTYRDNRGDFFFGVFYMIELVVPLLSAREILIQLQMKHTHLYNGTGIAIIIMFFICRILVFPYLYHAYAVHADIPMWLIPSRIPVKCNISCLAILLPQLYWFALMLRKLKQTLSNLDKTASIILSNGSLNTVSSANMKIS